MLGEDSALEQLHLVAAQWAWDEFHPEVVKAFKRVFETRFAELEDNVFSLNK